MFPKRPVRLRLYSCAAAGTREETRPYRNEPSFSPKSLRRSANPERNAKNETSGVSAAAG
jgi:hypothetical protein